MVVGKEVVGADTTAALWDLALTDAAERAKRRADKGAKHGDDHVSVAARAANVNIDPDDERGRAVARVGEATVAGLQLLVVAEDAGKLLQRLLRTTQKMYSHAEMDSQLVELVRGGGRETQRDAADGWGGLLATAHLPWAACDFAAGSTEIVEEGSASIVSASMLMFVVGSRIRKRR